MLISQYPMLAQNRMLPAVVWMVSDMVQSAAADQVFHALSKPTRQKVLERLSVGPATVSEPAAPLDVHLPSFVQHLSVLERSRLVKSKKRGRVRTYEIAAERFKVVDDWLTARRQLREARLDRFEELQTRNGKAQSAAGLASADG